MAKPRVLVLRSPGTNCDEETAYAFRMAGGEAESIHVNQLLAEPERLDQFQILCFPGGFSYGDDIAAGKILATQLKHFLPDAIGTFRSAGKLILGICNGFQILIKSGFLLKQNDDDKPATLTWNARGRYIDCWVHLKCDSSKCVFLNGIETMYLPIAHAEGKFVPSSSEMLEQWESNNQLAVRYCNPDGSNGSVEYPLNPNGSIGHVAGVCDESGRVFGLMPHPERHVDPTHHPRWTREGLAEAGDGLKIFENAIAYFA